MSNLFNVKERESSGQELYVGVIPDLKVVSVNPSKEELMTLLNTEKINEPNYMNNGKLRLDIWLQNKELNMLRKISLWLEDSVRVAKSSGNTQFINQKNQTCWAQNMQEIASKESMKWFDLTTARECKVGEQQLYDFIVAYLNADTNEGNIILSSYDAIVKGDVTELRKLFEHFENRSIKLLAGVKDNRQVFYTNYFMRNENRSTNALRKALEDRDFDATYDLDGFKKYSIAMDANKESVGSIEGEKAKDDLF
jgi:hypothetical protein